MLLCNLPNNNTITNFIDVYNWGNYIIRYTCGYFVGGYVSRFCTDPFRPQDHVKITFPDDATSVEFIVQYWLDAAQIWSSFNIVRRTLPGGYCYRTAGTLRAPVLDEILCP